MIRKITRKFMTISLAILLAVFAALTPANVIEVNAAGSVSADTADFRALDSSNYKSDIGDTGSSDDETDILSSYIKGICQLPYGMIEPGQSGYLIGIETYPGATAYVEMLILDCTTMQWVYSTGKNAVPDNMLWTVWQPEYGYFWTLFIAYDKYGHELQRECYGFENIC